MSKTAWLILTVLILWSLPAYGETPPLPEPDRIPSLISVLRMHRSADFCGESLPMEIPEVRENFEKEMMLTLWNRAQTILLAQAHGTVFSAHRSHSQGAEPSR